MQLIILAVCATASIPGYFIDQKTADTTGFVLVKSSGGVELYERWYDIQPDVPARELKAVFKAKADVNAVSALIRDEAQGLRWNKNSSIYKVIREDPQWICYIQYNLPWPVNNQDCVLRYTTRREGNTTIIGFKSIEHRLFPARPEVMRIPDVEGKWMLTAKDGGLHVTYYITTTPSKKFPGWVTDPIVRNNLLDTMIEFRTLLEKEK